MKTDIKIKILSFGLVFTMLLCGCRDIEKAENSETSESTAATTTQAEIIDTAYENIPRFDSQGNVSVEFSFFGDPYALCLNLPVEWETASNKIGYSIRREKEEIGVIFSGEAQDTAEWTVLKSLESADGGLLTNTYIERRGEGTDAEYRYRFCYSYAFGTTKRIATMTVKVSEIDDFVENTLAYAGNVLRLVTESGIGILNDGQRQIKNIAILGNSFVGSSNIGAITQEMFTRNGKTCAVNAVSRGMANISTYTSDASMMSTIREGRYDIVFICGLYSASQVGALKTLKDACDAGNTKLVIFPAHNEGAQVIEQANKLLPELTCLNWKNEIDLLIAHKKINRWDFCVDDTYNNSKPLAGYVGAHMIYRAIYSSVPTVGVSNSIDQTYVNSLLGDYVTTGTVPLTYKTSVKYLSE